jgi:hypothetical protein
MNSRHSTPTVIFVFAFGLIALTTTTVFAQGGRLTGMSERDRNLLEREAQLTMVERGGKREVKREPQLLLSQINEDFGRLQAVNNEVKLKISKEATFDFKAISDAAAEIKKRSIRLRTNLVFPDSESKDAREKPSVLEPDSGQLKVSLQTLDRVIKSFVTNPVFTAAGVINAQQAAAAKGDLNTIIDLSDKIKKCADKLNKANGKTT